MKWTLAALVALFFVFLGVQYVLQQPHYDTAQSPASSPVVTKPSAATEREVAQATAAVSEPVTASVTDDETLPLSAKQQRILAAVEKFKELNDRDLLNALTNDPLAQDIVADILLALINDGYLEANSPLAVRAGFAGFTPLFFALIASNQMTPELLNQFIEQGSRLASNEEWMRAMAQQSNLDVIEIWYDQTGQGPEHHQELFNQALYAGNMALVDFVLETKGGKFDRLSFSGATAERIKESAMKSTSFSDESLRDYYDRTRDDNREVLKQTVLALHERRLKQTELLLLYAQLSDDERQQIENARATLQADIQRINDFFAAQEG